MPIKDWSLSLNQFEIVCGDFKKRLIARSWKIERMFAEAKQNHCLRKAKFRNIQKFQIQVYMIAMV